VAGWQGLKWKEAAFVSSGCLLIAAVSLVVIQWIQSAMLLFFVSTVLVTLLLCVYFYRFKVQSLKLAFILAVISVGVFAFAESIVFSVWTYLLDDALFIPGAPNIHSLFYLITLYALVVPIVLVIYFVKRRIPPDTALTEKAQSPAAIVAALILGSYLIIFSQQYHEGVVITLLSWSSVFVLVYTVATGICFVFYVKAVRTKQAAWEQELEHRALLRYIDESQKHQEAMRKFKHDQQNILLSLHSFIKEKDLDGLEQYYTSEVEPAFALITKNDFAMEALSKIKVREIKSILAAKLMLAQTQEIEVTFEADEEIDHIPADSVALVRMLGIILDNAIEAIEELGQGKLMVGCFKQGSMITFIVQNPCPPDIPALHQLVQPGFSSKGENRGLGLNNLSELVSTQTNVMLETTIEDGCFIQKLIITER